MLAIVSFLLSISCFSFVFAAGAPASESLDQLYEKAKKEGGKITLYAPLSSRAMEVIPQAFMKKFPGLTVNHIDATPDELLARASAEARGGRIIADVLGGSLAYIESSRRSKTAHAAGAAGSRGLPGIAEKRFLGRDGHAILYHGMEYQSGQKSRRAQEL